MRSNFNNPNTMTAKQILSSRGKVLSSGFMDEIDAEAERQAHSISRANSFRPHRPSRRSDIANRRRLISV